MLSPPPRLLFITAALALSACGGGPPACPERTPTPLDAATFGTLTGTVTFPGTVPASEPIEMKSGECAAHAGMVDDSLIVSDGRLKNAVVYVKSGLEGKVFALPASPLTLDQHGCTFVPHVAAARVCQTVRFLNSDNFLHNVHGESKLNGSFNFALSASGTEKSRVFTAPEVAIDVRCDVHPWMQSYLAVFDHPYFAVTGGDGAFSIAQLPAGEYQIEAWHEKLGTVTAMVTVSAGATAGVTLQFAP